MRVTRYVVAAVVVAAAVAIVPRVGHGSASEPQARPATQTGKARSANADTTYATTGVVKSVGTGSLVLTRAGKPGHEITFEVSPSAHREGSVAVGSPVSVRYRDEGRVHVATAITVQPTKSQAPAPSGRPGR